MKNNNMEFETVRGWQTRTNIKNLKSESTFSNEKENSGKYSVKTPKDSKNGETFIIDFGSNVLDNNLKLAKR